jgi:DNA polymerase epsilon subunit 2
VFVVLLLSSREASRYLVEVLESVDELELDDVIERVMDAVEKQPCTSSSIITSY